MSVFVDTGVFYAAFDEKASRYADARGGLSAVLRDASYGQVMTSDYVYDETVTLTYQRTGSTERAISVGERLWSTDGGPDAVTIYHITESLFEEAVDAFERFDDHGLSFTDATTVALADRHDVDIVLSFDDDFEGLVNERLDPTTIA